MPAIVWREETLNGAAEICLLKDRSSYFLRIYREQRKYSFASLKTGDLELARKKALEVYVETTSSAPKSRSRSYLLETAMEEWLKEREDDVANGELSEGSLNTYRQRIFQRILPYAKKQGVKSIGDLTKNTFLDYKRHYQQITSKGRWNEKSDGLSAQTINADISTLQSILKWMVSRDLLDPRLNPEFKKVRDRKDHREDSNPAFYPKDWKTLAGCFQDFIENGVQYVETKPEHPALRAGMRLGPYVKTLEDYKRRWRQQHFVLYVLWQYETGCRPHETNLIRFRDIEVRGESGDGSIEGAEMGTGKILVRINPKTKTGKRVVVARSLTYRLLVAWKGSAIAVVQQVNKAHNRSIEEGLKRGKLRDIPAPLSDDDLLFFNPFQQSGKRSNYTDIWYNKMWCELLEFCAERNKDFPQDAVKRYTKYSLRSSHITHELLRGTDIGRIADNVGNSQSEIERTYKRPMNELNIDYLAQEKATLFLLQDERDEKAGVEN